jgi:DNA recombination protein RmuC
MITALLISNIILALIGLVLFFVLFFLVSRLLNEQRKEQQQQRERFDSHQLNTLKIIQDSLTTGMQDTRTQITTSLTQQTAQVNQQLNKLTTETQSRLKEIGNQVDEKLNEGFKKTNETFVNVVKRLAIIDEAQKKITELSSNVVDLQDVLTDKSARGAFGEVQLNAQIRNMLPEKHFALQYELSNQTRVDCMLFLPEPTGNLAIDSKFPLESFQKYTHKDCSVAEKQRAITQFRQDIRKHIKDVASKYIIPGETSDGAILFIPAEAIFAEIHAHFPELVAESHNARVWLVSPTTMMAVLNIIRAVLKDAATRKQVHVIQEHLVALSKDFDRFQERMEKLTKHITQAQQDAEDIHKSSRKISSRFNKIEQVEITGETPELNTLLE